jgi:hypothetical protein
MKSPCGAPLPLKPPAAAAAAACCALLTLQQQKGTAAAVTASAQRVRMLSALVDANQAQSQAVGMPLRTLTVIKEQGSTQTNTTGLLNLQLCITCPETLQCSTHLQHITQPLLLVKLDILT